MVHTYFEDAEVYAEELKRLNIENLQKEFFRRKGEYELIKSEIGRRFLDLEKFNEIEANGICTESKLKIIKILEKR